MYFPLYVDLTERNILFVGGGRIAARRVHTLLPFAKHITVIAPEFDGFFDDLVREGVAKSDVAACGKDEEEQPQIAVKLLRRAFELSDLDHRELVFATTDDASLNEIIAQACRQCAIPVNVCTDQSLCDFQFPSVVMDEKVVIGVNASGKNHGLVKETRQKIEESLSEKGTASERNRRQEQ